MYINNSSQSTIIIRKCNIIKLNTIISFIKSYYSWQSSIILIYDWIFILYFISLSRGYTWYLYQGIITIVIYFSKIDIVISIKGNSTTYQCYVLNKINFIAFNFIVISKYTYCSIRCHVSYKLEIFQSYNIKHMNI